MCKIKNILIGLFIFIAYIGNGQCPVQQLNDDIAEVGDELVDFIESVPPGNGVKAWDKVRKGGIDDFINQPGYIKTLEKVAKYQDEALAGATGNVKYYRVQGGQGTGTSQNLLTVEPNGNLTFNSTSNNLNLSTSTREHADYFIDCCRPGGKIVEFEVPKSLDIQMKEAAVPQYKATQNLQNPNGTAPKIVDPCLLYTSPSPRDKRQSRMPSSA